MMFEWRKLEEEKLIRVKRYPDKKILKYTQKVFNKSLWTNDLVHCRGLVIDNDDKIVSYPFTKAFNLFEKGIDAKKTTVDRNEPVIAIEKVNGFLGVMSTHNGSLVFSTTGTLDSEYARMAERHIREQIDVGSFSQFLDTFNKTAMFEICDPNDPHIVYEKPGVYLIGMRENIIGSKLQREDSLDEWASEIGAYRPSWKSYDTFDEAKRDAENSIKEGSMIRDLDGNVLCKIKSKYYKVKKFMMRGRSDKVWQGGVDDDFHDLIDWIKSNHTQEEWSNLKEQERRVVVEQYYD